MLVPHTERQVHTLQVCVFAMLFLVFLLVSVAGGFSYLITVSHDTDQLVRDSSVRIRDAEASLEEVRSEIVVFLQAYDEFRAALTGTLRRIDGNAGLGGGRAGDFDLAALLRTADLAEEGLQEIQYLQRAVSSLRGAIGPLGELSEVIGLHRELLRDIPNMWPLINGLGRVTMEFGPNVHPFLKTWYMHRGFDIWWHTGTPIVAAGNGVVADAGFDPISGFGWFVEIDHAYGFRSKYAHMNSVDVRRGQQVTQGQRIGTLGSSGNSTGPHLHFEIHIGTELIDPAHFLKLSTPDFARRVRDRL